MIYEHLDTLTAQQREYSQAQARPARIRMHVDVSGNGETRTELTFGTMLLEEPTFTWGAVLRSKTPEGFMPLSSAAVVQYKANQRGFIVGAEMGFLIEGGLENVRLQFTLTFEAIALRAMNQAMQ